MQMDIERASGNIILHSIFVPLMEPGGRVEGGCKYLGKFSFPPKIKTCMKTKRLRQTFWWCRICDSNEYCRSYGQRCLDLNKR